MRYVGVRSVGALSVLLAGCSFFLSEPAGSDSDGGGSVDGSDGDDPWWDTSFTVRREVVIDNTGRPALPGFPVLVRVPMLDAGRVDDDGAGVRFIADDHSSELAHDVERWDNKGESQVWVRVDLPDNAPVSIWMYYDTAGRTETSDGTEVFAEFFGVYHFTGFFDASTPVLDSSGNGNDLSGLANMVESNSDDGVAGVVARAVRFDEGDGEHMETAGPVSSFVVGDNEQKMWEVWFRANSISSGTHVLLDNEDGNDGVSVLLADDGIVRGIFYAGSEFVADTALAYDDDLWHHAAFVIDRLTGTAELILDGGAEMIPANLPSDTRAGGANLRIGEDFDLPPQQFDGDVDEVRIGPARSPAWVAATYATVTTEMAVVRAEQRLP